LPLTGGARQPQLQKQALTQKRAPVVVDGQPHIGSATEHWLASVQLR
jgi:hypothetical protein